MTLLALTREEGDEKPVKEIKKPFHLDKRWHPLSWYSGKTSEVLMFGLCLGD